MSLTDELRKLQELHKSGALSAEEFAQAKAALIKAPPPTQDQSVGSPIRGGANDSLGEAAKTWVNYQVIMGIVGLTIAAIFFFAFFLPQWNKMGKEQDQFKRDFDEKWNEFPNK